MMDAQANTNTSKIRKDLKGLGIELNEKNYSKIKQSEIVALIAYLQRLGSDIQKIETPTKE